MRGVSIHLVIFQSLFNFSIAVYIILLCLRWALINWNWVEIGQTCVTHDFLRLAGWSCCSIFLHTWYFLLHIWYIGICHAPFECRENTKSSLKTCSGMTYICYMQLQKERHSTYWRKVLLITRYVVKKNSISVVLII